MDIWKKCTARAEELDAAKRRHTVSARLQWHRGREGAVPPHAWAQRVSLPKLECAHVCSLQRRDGAIAVLTIAGVGLAATVRSSA